MNDTQILVVLMDQNKDPNKINKVRVAIAKKNLPDSNITLLTAIGYEGGGCWAEFNGIYLMDEYDEAVKEVIEEFDYSDNAENYKPEMEELMGELYNYIHNNEDEDCPCLNDDLTGDLLGDPEDEEDDKYYESNWNCDNEAHFEASQNWSIFYRWGKVER